MFLQIHKILSNFDSNLLICDSTLFPGKNIPNIAKRNRVFPGKGRGDRALILTYLDSPMAEGFLLYCLSFSISAIFREKQVVKVGQEWKFWVCLFFVETQILHIFFKRYFCFVEYYLWWEFRQNWTIFWGVRAQKPPKMGHFMDAELVCKTLKTLNLTTLSAILMKLTAIMYNHESVNQKPPRARNSVFWRNVYEFLDYIKIPYTCHAEPCVASLVKFFY